MSKLLCLPEVKHYRGNINLEDFCARDKDGWKALELLTTAELGISRLLSLRRKFQYDLTVAEGAEKQDAMEEMERFIQSLCRCGEVRVPGAARGPAGRLIQALFRESNQINHPRPSGLPPPVVKQFTLRCVSGRPLPSSRPTPQRLYARFSSGEFRLTGAYTLDRQYL
ncbi:rab3 GTPase-activating protein catalytic subunit [Eurytemora carolleeae]|uniref:rab3 GTPase-activating protein catalytic subunit n=1 Tax=Eurytemora carolleeae TaxID=1294199 RepID=UPI000C7817B6|nr:rab3 GTPase-activating protein catalytic subunit [Eurytemora carolleeae]|eukprot:XP_023324110.1 rab3 GTPase-activating protein catalytic subunit-like [Eurytemora affinis]